MTVTISFGQKVRAAQFTLNYDSSSLEYVSYSCGGSGKSNFIGNKFGYQGADKADISSVKVTFKAKGTATKAVTASNLKIATDIENSASTSKCGISINVKSNSNNTSNGSNNSNNSNNSNSNNNSSTKKPTTTTKKPTTTTTEEPKPVEPTPNELIKLDNESAKTLNHNETNVMIKYMPNALEDGVILEVKNVDSENEKYKSINEMLKGITGNKMYFDINLLKNNVKIQPNGYVTVYLLIPEEYNKEKLELYYINEENSTYELVQGEIQEDYYTFTTNHFSTYALVEKTEKLEETEPIQEVSAIETVRDVFTNVILLYVIIVILVIIVIVQRVKISKLQD